ncbi:hypothetical protein Pla86_47420 [Planctomycetes bacterium Pla86]|uniref:Uncharacterized protein n=2 Tax=Engelhardtia mirabilis TaxID=2528011 RepID=A0A518BRN6_9BACT|nr:hypothetical protein Pla133_47440 [Planctomycetes bacterium Pla133]QDV03949.1 hypothetical protein Pla86_47420 [Planctomycetes bacterium Pla86]
MGALQRSLSAGVEPNPALAVAVLVPLGRLLLEGSLDGVDQTISVLVDLVDPSGANWREAVAVGVIARERDFAALLDDPTSDPADLSDARTDLEALFCASDALGEPVPEALRERVSARDGELEARL